MPARRPKPDPIPSRWLRVTEVIPVEQAISRLTRYMTIRFDPSATDDGQLLKLRSMLEGHHGATPVILSVRVNGSGTTFVQASNSYSILPSEELKTKIESTIERAEVAFHG